MAYTSTHTGQQIDSGIDKAVALSGIFFLQNNSSAPAVTSGTTHSTYWQAKAISVGSATINADADLFTGLTVAFIVPANCGSNVSLGTTLKIGNSSRHAVCKASGSEFIGADSGKPGALVLLTYDASTNPSGVSGECATSGVWKTIQTRDEDNQTIKNLIVSNTADINSLEADSVVVGNISVTGLATFANTIDANVTSANNADTVDNQHASEFVHIANAETITGNKTFNGLTTFNNNVKINVGEGLLIEGDNNYFGENADARIISLIDTNDNYIDGGLIIRATGTNNGVTTNTELLRIRALGSGINNNEFKWKGNVIWHAGNDGSGSGLDADLLDGKHATDFVTIATEQTITGKKSFTNDVVMNTLKFGTNSITASTDGKGISVSQNNNKSFEVYDGYAQIYEKDSEKVDLNTSKSTAQNLTSTLNNELSSFGLSYSGIGSPRGYTYTGFANWYQMSYTFTDDTNEYHFRFTESDPSIKLIKLYVTTKFNINNTNGLVASNYTACTLTLNGDKTIVLPAIDKDTDPLQVPIQVIELTGDGTTPIDAKFKVAETKQGINLFAVGYGSGDGAWNKVATQRDINSVKTQIASEVNIIKQTTNDLSSRITTNSNAIADLQSYDGYLESMIGDVQIWRYNELPTPGSYYKDKIADVPDGLYRLVEKGEYQTGESSWWTGTAEITSSTCTNLINSFRNYIDKSNPDDWYFDKNIYYSWSTKVNYDNGRLKFSSSSVLGRLRLKNNRPPYLGKLTGLMITVVPYSSTKPSVISVVDEYDESNEYAAKWYLEKYEFSEETTIKVDLKGIEREDTFEIMSDSYNSGQDRRFYVKQIDLLYNNYEAKWEELGGAVTLIDLTNEYVNRETATLSYTFDEDTRTYNFQLENLSSKAQTLLDNGILCLAVSTKDCTKTQAYKLYHNVWIHECTERIKRTRQRIKQDWDNIHQWEIINKSGGSMLDYYNDCMQNNIKCNLININSDLSASWSEWTSAELVHDALIPHKIWEFLYDAVDDNATAESGSIKIASWAADKVYDTTFIEYKFVLLDLASGRIIKSFKQDCGVHKATYNRQELQEYLFEDLL